MIDNATTEPIAEPQFSSNVPGPLLDMCKNSEEGHIRKYLLESQSIQSQQIQWLIRNAIGENRSLRQIENRLSVTEEKTQSILDWKNNFNGKTAVAAGVIIMFVSALFGCLGKIVADKFSKFFS